MSRATNRATLAALAVGVLAAAAWVVLAALGAAAMPSYLAAWLFWIGVPMGALPLVMAAEGLGAEGPLLPVLRRMLLLLPLGAMFAVPVFAAGGSLFARTGVMQPLPAWWTEPAFLAGRAAAILIVLSLLALAFSRPARRPRRALAAFGSVLHLCLATLAAADWVLSIQPGIGSSALGLLLIAAQAGLAASLAAFLLAVATPGSRRVPGGAGLLVALLLAGWAFLQFMQFLVVWSANLPAEAAWYLGRIAGLGVAMVAFAATVVVLGCGLLPSPAGRVPAVLATLAATVLLAHLLATLWLVTPAFRGTFSLTATDALAMLGLGGLLVCVLLLVLPSREANHGPA